VTPYRCPRKFLAYYRAFAAIATAIYMIIIVVINGNELFLYLTNWGNLMMAVNFMTLTFAHWCDGDYFFWCAKP
jgi:hypothetical protein